MAPQERSPTRLSSSAMEDEMDLSDDTSSELQLQQQQQKQHDRHFYFLTEQAATELTLYQYRGKDLSLTYKYVLSPLAEWCVHTLTPKTVAPNTITLTGLLWMIAAYLAMWYYIPQLLTSTADDSDNNAVPCWVFLLNAVSILIYQTLDNMDGKQARRVGASSPLGLLFDHGCDAINSVFGSANWMVALALSRQTDLVLCFIMLMGPYALFFVGTWEEFYTGELVMPILNGPNEGLLGAVAMSLVSAAYGTGYWHETGIWDSTLGPYFSSHIGSLRNADLLVIASSIGFVQETSLKILGVARNYGIGALQNLVPFATLTLCGLLVGLVDVDVWLSVPRTSLHLCAILFVEMTTELMLKHMTKQPYQAYRWILMPLVLLTVGVTSGAWPSHLLSTDEFLMIYAAASAMYLAMKTSILIDEICSVLNIWCFDIVTPRKRRLRSSDPQRVKAE